MWKEEQICQAIGDNELQIVKTCASQLLVTPIPDRVPTLRITSNQRETKSAGMFELRSDGFACLDPRGAAGGFKTVSFRFKTAVDSTKETEG